MKILQTTISLWLIACRGKILPLPRSEFWPGAEARITREPEHTRLIGTAQEIKMKKHSCEFPWFGQFQCCFITQTCTVYIILHCRRRSGKWNGCSSRRRTPWEAKINSEDKFRNSPLFAQTGGRKGKCLQWGRHLLMQQMFSSPQHLCMMTICSGGLECRSFSPQLELLCKWQFMKEVRDNRDPIVPNEKLSSCQLCTVLKSFQKRLKSLTFAVRGYLTILWTSRLLALWQKLPKALFAD